MVFIMSTASNICIEQSQASAVYMFPVSLGQHRLWLNYQRSPQSSVYNVVSAVRLVGPLDIDTFSRTVHEIVRRHESLRTHFVAIDGEPQQVISPCVAVEVPLVDLIAVPDTEREEHARRLVQEEIDAPFNIERPPLWRLKLFRLQEQEHVLVVAMHHIISDGWSIGVMLREVSALYSAFVAGKPSPLPELAIQYADFSEWERNLLQGNALQRQLSYWTARLSGTPALNLPYDRPKTSPPPGKGGSYVLRVEPHVAEGLRRLSQQHNATLYMTLLAAYQTLLYRYTGQQDIAVGSNIARRTRVELEGLIGYFTSNVIIRTKLSHDWGFCKLLGQVREAALEAYANQYIPFDRVVQELAAERDPNRPLIFHATFTLQNLPRAEFRLPTLDVTPFETHIAPAKHDISVFVTDAEGPIFFGVLYNRDLFDPETITGIFEHYAFLLESIVADPEQQLAKLSLCNNWKEGNWSSIRCLAHAHELSA